MGYYNVGIYIYIYIYSIILRVNCRFSTTSLVYICTNVEAAMSFSAQSPGLLYAIMRNFNII